MEKTKSFYIFTGVFAGLLFGVATPLNKMLISQMNPFDLAGLLYLGAGISMVPFVIIRGKKFVEIIANKKQIKLILGVVLFGGLFAPLLLLMGLRIANSASVSIFLNMELVATAIIGVMLFKDQVDRFSLIGLILTVFAGLIVALSEGHSSIIAGLFVVGACICWGVDNNLTAIIDGITPQQMTFIKGIFAGSINLLIGLSINRLPVAHSIIFYAILIGMISYGISIVLYIVTAQQIGATRGQILFATAPFWGILFAFLLLKSEITIAQIIAIMLLAGGILFTSVLVHEHEHTHEEIEHIHMHSHNDDHHNHTHEYEVAPNVRHTHMHKHEKITHTHKHFPDLHHRHSHNSIVQQIMRVK